MRLTLWTLVIVAQALAAPGVGPEAAFHAGIGVKEAGPVRMDLPAAVLDKTRKDLADLRVRDPEGKEIPFRVERLAAGQTRLLPMAAFKSAGRRGRTVLTARLKAEAEIEGVLLETPAHEFLKSATVEASPDGKRWKRLAQKRPVFRQAGGAGNIHILFTPAPALHLRVTLDDARSAPVAFTGLRARSAPVQAPAVVLTFQAAHAGEHALVFGNPEAKAPRFPLSALDSLPFDLAQEAALGAVRVNPDYQPPSARIPEGTLPPDTTLKAQGAKAGKPAGARLAIWAALCAAVALLLVVVARRQKSA